MFKWMGGLIDRIFAVIGAVIFLQAPAFIQQYAQRLAGHVSELRLQVDMMRQAALMSDKSLEQFIQKFTSSGDVDFARQGELMQNMLTRYQDLQSSANALQHASVFSRPFVLLSHLNWDIAKAAITSFHFEISFTLEALIYAVIGIVVGCLIYRFIRGIIRAIFKPLTSAKKTSPTL
jgi:hypothetical protein